MNEVMFQMRQKIVSILLLCAMMTALSFSLAMPSSANPIAIGLVENGSAFHKGEFIHMPVAEVEINMTRISDSVTVDLLGIYVIETNQTQNTSLAYVYPSSSLPVNMTIQVDSVETEFTILTWSELVELNFSQDTLDLISRGTDFAYFNVSLIANTSMVLEVDSHYTFSLVYADYWEYRYIFGSARSFDGDTWETIHIHLDEQTQFLSTGFHPDDYLELTQDGIITDAIWEFNVSSMALDEISFTATVRYSNPPGFTQFVIIISVILGFAVFLVYYIQKRIS
jgi:hypothetical protein